MILLEDYWKNNLIKLSKKPHNYLVLNTSHMGCREDIDKFKNSIHVLDVFQTLNWGNELYGKLNLKKSLNTGILFDVLKSIYTEEAFTNKQLQEYFQLMQGLTEFEKQIKKLYPHVETVNISSQVEFVLLGISWEEQEDLEEEKVDELNQNYVPVLVDLLEKKITVKQFLDSAKGLIKNTRKCLKAA